MDHRRLPLLQRLILILLAVSLALGGPGPVVAASVTGARQASACGAPPNWWSDQGLQPPFENPATAEAPQTDCAFQQWSWTAFVHWMQTDSSTGRPLFLSLTTPEELAVRSGLKGNQAIPKGLTMQARFAKPLPEAVLEEIRAATPGGKVKAGSINQAAGGALVAQNGRALYYTTHMNKAYADFAGQYLGKDYNNAPDDLDFPVGSTVLKAAWRVLEDGEDRVGLYTTEANVQVLDVDAAGALVVANPIRYRKETMALVGVHVVGRINEHPEFVWATFESNLNSPNLPVGMSSNSPLPVSDRDWLFYKAGTAASASNISNQREPAGGGAPSLSTPYTINMDTQVITPITNVFRMFAYGGAKESVASPGTDRVRDINEVNEDFMATIAAGNPKIEPVFADYRLIGSVWIDTAVTPLKPGLDLRSSSVGSIYLANSTLETFFQSNQFNCFTCHSTSPNKSGYPDKNIAISHIISGSLPDLQPAS
jgi:hypothetical protein